MPSYQTRYGLFGITSGTTQPASDMALAIIPSGLFAPEARKGQLYVVVETDQEGTRARDACQLVLRTLRKTFYEDSSLSVTSSLRKALIAANRALYQQNFSMAAAKRALLGITCAVIKDGDLYVAQIAPTQLYVLGEGRLRAIPPSSAWEPTGSAPLSNIRMRALGATLTVEPEFYRAVLRANDGVLLCSSNLTPHLARDMVQQVLYAGDPQRTIQELSVFCRERQISDAHGLLIGLSAALSPAAQAAPLSTAGILGWGALLVRGVLSLVVRASAEVMLLFKGPLERLRRQRSTARVERELAERSRMQDLPAEVFSSPDPPPMPRPIDLGESIGERLVRGREERVGRAKRGMPVAGPERVLPASALLGEPDYGRAAAPERRVDLGGVPRAPRSDLQSPIVSAFDEKPNGALAQINGYFMRASRNRRMRKAPGRATPQARQTPGLSYRRERVPFPWVRLLMLVSLVTILLLYGLTLSNQNQVKEIDTGLTTAEQAVASVFQAVDEREARDRLRAAAEAIAVVQSSGTITGTADGRQRFSAVQREYAQAETSILKISYFSALSEVARNPQSGSLFETLVIPPPPQGITNTAGFASIYMLDANAGILYRQAKSGGSVQAILRPQDSYGPLNVGPIRGIAWRFDSIVAVSQSSEGGPYNFYFRSGETWNRSLLAGSEIWNADNERFRIANYEGNLYVWGADPTNILRYRSGEYGSFPEPWIEDDGNKKYAATVDIAVDGKIYMLQPDGRILVFAFNDAGKRAYEREIVPQAIEPPLTVTRFVVTGEPDSGFIFLVDSFHNRIVQIDKRSGAFIQQIKAAPDSAIGLNNMVNLAIDTGVGRPVLYMLIDNGAQVVRAELPDPPRPFRSATTPGAIATPAPTPTP